MTPKQQRIAEALKQEELRKQKVIDLPPAKDWLKPKFSEVSPPLSEYPQRGIEVI